MIILIVLLPTEFHLLMRTDEKCAFDQTQMAEALRKVAKQALIGGIVLLRHQPQVVAQSEQPLEQALGVLVPSLQLVVVGQPEAARDERPFAGGQAVDVLLRLVAVHQPVLHQPLLDRRHGADDARVPRLDFELADGCDHRCAHCYNVWTASDDDPQGGYTTGPPLPTPFTDARVPDRERPPLRKRGRVLLGDDGSIDELLARQEAGWMFRRTLLTERFTLADKLKTMPEGTMPVAVLKPGGRLVFFSSEARPSAEPGDQLITFGPPER